eukprot:scaffold3646_cov257-Chaetoceros_neogracile.AAC.1
MKLKTSFSLIVWCCMNLAPSALAFTLNAPALKHVSTVNNHQRINNYLVKSSSSSSTSLFMAEEENKIKKGGLDTSTRSRLLSESIAPWRTLRLFLYGSLGSGAALGGFITLAGVVAGISGARADLDLKTEYLNLAIDFGAVAIFVFLAKWDFDQSNELNDKVKVKMQQKKDNKVIRKAMKERELTLSKLNLDIRVTADGTMQAATVEAIQTGGKQHMIVVAGGKKAIRDALLGANILKMEFSIRDVIIVPYELGKTQEQKEDEAKLKPVGSGFGKDSRPTWETQPYVAQPIGEGWDEFIRAEVEDAVQQNGEKVKEDGVAIVVSNSGEIIRRGVGQVPWRNMVEELENAVKDDEMIDLGFLQG